MRRVFFLCVLFLMTAGAAWAATSIAPRHVRTSTAPGQATEYARAGRSGASRRDSVLFGDKTVEPAAGRDASGSVKAFRFAGKRTGTALSITVYVGSRSRVRTLVVGIFADTAGGPGRLLASGSLSRPAVGAWNRVVISSVAVKAGRAYWVAVLARGGTLYFRVRRRGSCSSESYSKVHFAALRSSAYLSSLKGRHSHTCPISAYVSGKLSASGRATPRVGSPNTVTNPPSPVPVNTTLPVISLTAPPGDALTTTNGSWSNSPTAYSYQWQDCDSSGSSCVNISGATSSTYTPQASDVGHTIDVIVTATNASGSNSVTAAYVGPVTGGSGGGAPSNTVAPYFVASIGDQACTNGCAIVGQKLQVQPGTWTCSGGCGTLIYTYQWQDCKTTSGQPPATSSCSNATGVGATTARYTVAAGDLGKSLVPIVTAHNNSAPSTPTTIAGSRCGTGEIPYINPDDAYSNAARTPGPLVAGVGCSPISAQVATTQARELFCSNAPTTCGYGDPLAGSVGVPPGTMLTSIGSLSLGTGGCSALGSPAWCSGSGTSANPWVVNAVSTSSVKVSGSGYWTIENSHISEAASECVVCVGGGPLTMLDDTVAGVDNTTNEAQFGVYNTSFVTSNVTMNGVYFYNGERILEDAGTVENSFCYENGSQAGSHLECHHGCGGPNRGFVSTNNVYVEPWGQTADFDQEDDNASYCDAQPGPAISSQYDLFVGGGGYAIYPESSGSDTDCGTSNITDDRFSRFFWAENGQWGVDYTPGCPDMTWNGNIWDDTGATVSPTS